MIQNETFPKKFILVNWNSLYNVISYILFCFGLVNNSTWDGIYSHG